MKRISLPVFLLLGLFFGCDTEKNVGPAYEKFFTKYYGEDGNQESADLLVNTDGSMILLGNSTSQTETTPIPFLVKIDGNGNVIWQRQLGSVNEKAVDVEVDRQGDLIVLSNIGSGDASRIRLFRIDQNGRGIDSVIVKNIISSATDVREVGQSITQQFDGNFLIAGYAGSGFVDEPSLSDDQDDLLVYRISEDFQSGEQAYDQGGEHVGKFVKIFETEYQGTTRYLIFGDSDRPFNLSQTYRQTFEVIDADVNMIADGGRPDTGDASQIQVASTAINTSTATLESYLVIGTTSLNANSSIFLTQYTYDNKKLTVRLGQSLSGNRMEGVSAAVGQGGTYFILGNSYRDNALPDIILYKMLDNGEVLGAITFGSLEGADSGAAVTVLQDGRVVVFGTIQLETQKKMVLFVISPDGQFINGS